MLDEHMAALVLFPDHGIRTFTVLLHIQNMRTPSRTQKTAHFETMLPFFAHEYRPRTYCMVFCISAKGPLVLSWRVPSTQRPHRRLDEHLPSPDLNGKEAGESHLVGVLWRQS